MIARTIFRLGLRFLLSLLLASAVIFLLLRAIPGDPARVALGVTATDEAVARLAEQLGTDRPLAVQYLDWVGGLLTGDFGVSLSSRQDITALVLAAFDERDRLIFKPMFWLPEAVLLDPQHAEGRTGQGR